MNKCLDNLCLAYSKMLEDASKSCTALKMWTEEMMACL